MIRFSNKQFTISAVLLILILCASLANVHSALADDATPTEPPTATEEPTEPPVSVTATPIAPEPSVEPTSTPVSATATSEASQDTPIETTLTEATPVADLLSHVSENTELVVLHENGQVLSLASQDAAEIIELADPIWCPEGQLPTIGQNGCTSSFASISDLLNDVNANPANYAQNGVIYLEDTKPSNPATTITSAVVIDNASYSSLFTNLSIYNLTIQGGWNPNWNPNNPNSPMINEQTDFLGAGAYLQIGSSSNPWAGNVTLNDIKIGVTGSNGGGGTNNGLTIYTSGGDISLNNVDVRQQEGNHYYLLQFV